MDRSALDGHAERSMKAPGLARTHGEAEARAWSNLVWFERFEQSEREVAIARTSSAGFWPAVTARSGSPSGGLEVIMMCSMSANGDPIIRPRRR